MRHKNHIARLGRDSIFQIPALISGGGARGWEGGGFGSEGGVDKIDVLFFVCLCFDRFKFLRQLFDLLLKVLEAAF